MCPKGNDVMDERLDLTTALNYQTQTVTLIGAGALGDGVSTVSGCGAASDDAATDACFVDLVGKSFAFTYTSKLNQSYTTKPIIVSIVDDANSGTVAAAETATATAVHDALHQLPNYVVDGCTVTCTYAYKIGVSALYPSVSCDIGFTGGSVAGPQYLLEVEADKCDSGCTPQLSDPVQLKSAQFATTGAADFKTGVEDTAAADFSIGDTQLTTTGMGTKLGGDADPALKYILCGAEVFKVTKIAGEVLDVTAAQAGTTAADCLDTTAIYELSAAYTGAAAPVDPLSFVAETVQADYNSFECGRRGKCDYSSGECECFEGYMGDRCQTQTALI